MFPQRPSPRPLLGLSVCVCAGVFGCAAPRAPEPRVAPIRVAAEAPQSSRAAAVDAPDPLEALGADYRQRFQERASLGFAGRLYFDPTGRPLMDVERRVEVPFELVVVGQSERFLRVALADAGAVVLAYVPKQDFQQRITREVRLLLDPLPKADRRTGVFLRPGARVQIKTRSVHHFRAVFRDADLNCEGFVPKSALGEVYEPARPNLGVLELDTGSELLSAPEGPVLGCKLTPGVRLVRVLAETGDHTLVEYASSWLRVVGWVRSARVHNASEEATVKLAELGGYGRGEALDPSVQLLPGAPLFDADGSLVGRVVSETSLGMIRRGAERSELRLRLPPWGDVSVWANDVSLAASPGSHPTSRDVSVR